MYLTPVPTSCTRAACVLALLLAAYVLNAGLQAQDAGQKAVQHFQAAQAAEKARRFEVALREYELASRFAEQAYANTPDDYRWANRLNGQADMHLELGQNREAKDCLNRSLAIFLEHERRGDARKEHALVASITLRRLGDLELSAREYTQAEHHLQKSLRLHELYGVSDAFTASAHNSLGYLYYTLGLTDEEHAAKHLQASRRLWAQLGIAPPEKAYVLNSLALMCIAQQRYADAKPLLTECIGILEPVAKDHLVLGKAHGNLGWVLHQQGDHRGAEASYRKALAVWELRKGRSDRDLARTLSNLGWVKHSLGEFGEAEDFYQQALKLRSDDLQQLALSKANLALLHAAQDQWQPAFDRMEDALKDLKHFMARALPEMPERLQLSFVLDDTKQDSLASFLHTAMSLAYEGRKQPDAAKRAATWLLNCKAIAYQALTSRERAARDAALRGNKQARELLRLREELAALALIKDTHAAQDQKQIELESLAVHFGKAATQLSVHELERWIELSEVHAALGRLPETVLLEYVRFKRWDFHTARAVKGGKEHYAACVIKENKEVELVDLGSADEVDEGVNRLSGALALAEKQVQSTRSAGTLLRKEHSEQMQAILKGLAQKVLWPVLPHVEMSRRWLISPDHQLWFVPWAALPDDKDTPYVVQKHTLSCLLSGRELLANRPDGKSQASLMLAFPNYNLGSKQDKPRVLPALDRLDGTKREAEEIEPFLKKLDGQARVLQNQEALEEVVKRAVSPQILALSTHGFFLDKSHYGTSRIPANALLRCGVALAGCNNGSDGRGQDGVLTGEEVLGLDLRRTELVVLSACQTGVGNVQAGEGVASMRQAFHLAGARSVLATLWSVPDLETQTLLTAYFRSLVSQQKDKAEALAEAQRALIVEYEKEYGAANPYLWAALTLTGDPGRLD